MKSKDFAKALRQFADVLAVAHPHAPPVAAIRNLASVFETAPAVPVAALVKRLGAKDLHLVSGSPTLGDIAHVFAPLQLFLTGHAKAAIVADLKLVGSFLTSNAHVGIKSLLQHAPQALAPPARTVPASQPLREDLVVKYLRRLEDARADDPRFMTVYHELSTDPEIGKLEAVALAKRFAGSPATARAAALKKLLSHHRALMTFRAKSESRDGRSAA
jgi:hypothetical protein